VAVAVAPGTLPQGVDVISVYPGKISVNLANAKGR
jgi:hypothetical protein